MVCMRLLGWGLDWKLDRERRTRIDLAVDVDRSAMGLDELPGDIEAEPEAAGGARRRLLVPTEDPFEVLLRDSLAAVPHTEDGARAVALDGDLDRLARAELDRVRDQVCEHLLDPDPIPDAYH